MLRSRNILDAIAVTNAAVVTTAACYFFLAPACIVILAASGSELTEPTIPRMAWSLHKRLAPELEDWARARVRDGAGAGVDPLDVAGTEWPLFGSAFYLWATESLQTEWDEDGQSGVEAPRRYARGAIEALTQFVLDPSHATWVREHWGDDYLMISNVFYRMLRIGAMSAHVSLIRDGRHDAQLAAEADRLARDLDGSPSGLLDDYPGECCPGDVLMALTTIARVDSLLGTDHGDMLARARRAFFGRRLDGHGLPPYASDAATGLPLGPSRGCSNAYITLAAPDLWPDEAKRWYAAFSEHFWQEDLTAVGFREFAGDQTPDWHVDVDSGPVVAGFGFAANAFGVGAARRNGRLDQAYPLASEMIAVSWPLLDGTLVIPSLLSRPDHAPHLGEIGILFNLAQRPAQGVRVVKGGAVPRFVHLVVALFILCGVYLIRSEMRAQQRWWRTERFLAYPRPRLQAAVWGGLLVGAVAIGVGFHAAPGLILAALAQAIPRKLRTETPVPAGSATRDLDRAQGG